MPKVKRKPKSVQIHLDADFLIYAAGFAAQKTHLALVPHDAVEPAVRFEGNATSSARDKLKAWTADITKDTPDFKLEEWGHVYERIEVEPLENALHTVKLQLHKLLERVEGKFGLQPELGVYLTGTGNFREKIATIRPYKGNRPPWHRPRLYREIRQYLVQQWGAQVIHDQEADDEVAIRQTQAEQEGRPSVIVGIDKDLWQVPGWHYSTLKDAFARVSPALGLRLFYRQLLTGDQTDNIGGVYRLGEVKAKKLIEPGMTEPTMLTVCKDAYQASLDKYGAERCGYADAAEALAENANLLWLRRRPGETFWQALLERLDGPAPDWAKGAA